MLYKETVTSHALERLNELMSDETLQKFILVGGTALSLQIGHRMSVDLDLFSQESFDEMKLKKHLESAYTYQNEFTAKDTLIGLLKDVKVDFIAHQYQYIKAPKVEENIRLASLEDIAAMKLNAIHGNGTRLKDFIDVAYLSSHLTLSNMVESYTQKYPSTNAISAIKALNYHDDIKHSQTIQLMGSTSFNWLSIKKRLLEMTKNPNNLFPAISILNKNKTEK